MLAFFWIHHIQNWPQPSQKNRPGVDFFKAPLVGSRLLKAALLALHVTSISVQIFGCMCVVMASLFVLNLAHEQCEGGAADISPRASRAPDLAPSQNQFYVILESSAHKHTDHLNFYGW